MILAVYHTDSSNCLYKVLTDDPGNHPAGKPYPVKEGDPLVAEVIAYLAEHPEALVPEPVPPPPSAEEIAAAARAHRDSLLAASDWTQLPDAPVDREAWATHRQKLRDIPSQKGFPENIAWPISS